MIFLLRVETFAMSVMRVLRCFTTGFFSGLSLVTARFDCVRTKSVSSLRSLYEDFAARSIFVLSGAAFFAA